MLTRRILGLSVATGSTAYLVISFAKSYQRIPWNALDLELSYVVMAIFLIGACHVANSFLWTYLLVGSGVSMRWREGFGVYALSQATKYLPGGIWQPVSSVAISKRRGVATSSAAAATLTHLFITVMSASILGGTLLGLVLDSRGWWVLAALPLVFLVHPRSAAKTFEFAARFLHRPWKLQVTIPFARTLHVLLLSSLLWLGYGLSTAWLGVAADLTEASDSLLIIGAFSLSWAAGFLAFPVPGGIGVREAVFVFLTTPAIGAGESVIVAALSRFAFTLCDGGLAGFAYYVLKGSRVAGDTLGRDG